MTMILRPRVWRSLIVLVLVALSLPAWPPAEKAAADGTLRLRIGVTRDGIVEIDANDLSTEVLALLNANPDAVAMSSMGQPVAARVITDTFTGEFRSLQFFGRRFRGTAAEHPEQEEKYTDERVYWLDIGGAPGPKIADVDAAPRPELNLTPPNDFLTTVHAEESNIWWTLTSGASIEYNWDLIDKWDTWFWKMLQTRKPSLETLPFPYIVPDPASGFTATLRLEEIPDDYSPKCNPDHRTVIALNNVPLLDQLWDNKERKVFTTTLPADLLASGTNTVTVSAFNPPDLESCYWAPNIPKPLPYDVYVNYWEIDYRRLFHAWDGQTDFVTEEDGPHEYLVSGWADGQVETWDISDPNQPIRLYDLAAETTGGDTSLRFYTADVTGAHFWMQAADMITGPSSLRVSEQSIRAQPNHQWVEALIVTPAVLRPAADRLAIWHEDQGRHALVVDIQDVYDEFNDGIYHPKAVPQMLAWFAQERVGGAPTYLTLVGDGHWNFKNFGSASITSGPNLIPPSLGLADPWQGEAPAEPLYGDLDFDGMPEAAMGRPGANTLDAVNTVDGVASLYGWPNLIPPYLAWVDPWQGEVPADPLYGDLDFDGMPEVAVGRLAVNTLDEANTVVDKIINYRQIARVQAWQQQALFVADDATDYQSTSNYIIDNYLPDDISPQRVYLGQPTVPDPPSARAAISDALRSGVLMLQYSGHGAINLWSKPIWTTKDVSGLQNSPMFPIVMTFNCLDGYFAYPGLPSMAETWQRQPNGGAIAAISPSGLGTTPEQHTLRKLMMGLIFQEDVRDLGRALLIAKQRYPKPSVSPPHYAYNYQVATMTFYGDPAMRLPGPVSSRVFMPFVPSTH